MTNWPGPTLCWTTSTDTNVYGIEKSRTSPFISFITHYRRGKINKLDKLFADYFISGVFCVNLAGQRLSTGISNSPFGLELRGQNYLYTNGMWLRCRCSDSCRLKVRFPFIRVDLSSSHSVLLSSMTFAGRKLSWTPYLLLISSKKSHDPQLPCISSAHVRYPEDRKNLAHTRFISYLLNQFN